jgi:hypothetical protein
MPGRQCRFDIGVIVPTRKCNHNACNAGPMLDGGQIRTWQEREVCASQGSAIWPVA